MIFGILVDPKSRDSLNQILNQNGIGTRICWPPVHTQDYHKKFLGGNFPNAESIGSRIINVPIGNGITEADLGYVTDILNKNIK